MGVIRRYISRLKARIGLNKRTFIFYSILRVLVIITAVRCIFTHNYESFMLCILSLILFLVPSFFEDKLKIEIPAIFQICIYAFIYAAEILGEVNKFYTAIPGWDTMLHTINGFLCAAIGFSLVDIMNRGSRYSKLSPLYLAVTAFCFSMTIGVLWEFFEFSMDRLFFFDTQKDFIVRSFASVTLDPAHSQTPVRVSDITRTIIETANGTQYVIDGGYLDIGIIDTMKDLIVNFIGASVFSVIGYIYVKHNEQGSTASKLLIQPLTDEDIEAQEKYLADIRKEIKQDNADK